MIDISEHNFEESIEQGLLAQGYKKRNKDDYDRELCLILKDALDFIKATQPKTWKKLSDMHGPEAKDRLLDRLASEIKKRGTLAVLRKGIKTDGCKFQLAYFHPASGLNEELQRLYEANIFGVMRQLHYSVKTEQSLDVGIFLNGLPIFTAELKNPLNGQNVKHAVSQYRFDRDPREPLFAFGRCLAYFAVDPDQVYVTTHLQGKQTRFLPFNQGRNGGAGNLPSAWNFSTAYLWEKMWSKDSVLDLIQHFIHEIKDEIEDGKGRKKTKRRLIFPRYHQLDCVRRLVADAKEKGTNQKYLIQHSAGSGKSNSIAWLAHQFSVLHDAEDRRVFDSIIIITDRIVLDRQLQNTVSQFEQVEGVVENIDKTSKQLKQALEEGKTIIVTTLQKFPVIADEVGKLPGHRFAVIIDEAHSSQTGESTKSLKTVLAAEKEDEGEGPETYEDMIIAEMHKRKQPKNVSYFAFTATPKPKTMELFGSRQEDGTFNPFSLYSMRQAIEEGFVLDVLENYTIYKTYWKLLKKIKDDPRYERSKANRLLKAFVASHKITIAQKVKIMVEHFVNNIMHRIEGKAKAMIVTRSRLHAVKFKLAVDSYLREKGYKFKTLVAFSGTITDGGIDFTEAGMNGISQKQTAETFKQDEYKIMVVAYKFQTGFDQPLLHTMYVDKKLRGVHAVQTLSRLNRVYPGKDETMVLDFVNDVDTIQESFQPYYDRTILTEATDPNLLYDLEARLMDYHFHSQHDIDRFAEVYFDPRSTQHKLYSVLQPVVDRCQVSTEDARKRYRKQLVDYVRLYAFLSQILPFDDADLEKLFVFAKLLIRRIKLAKEELPVEIREQIELDFIRQQKMRSGSIKLERGRGELEPMQAKKPAGPFEDEKDPLSKIIKELNEIFGTDFTEEDRVFLEQLEIKLDKHEGLAKSARINTKENAKLTFDLVAKEKLQEMIDTNFEFYKQINDNEELAKRLLAQLFERYLRRILKGLKGSSH